MNNPPIPPKTTITPAATAAGWSKTPGKRKISTSADDLELQKQQGSTPVTTNNPYDMLDIQEENKYIKDSSTPGNPQDIEAMKEQLMSNDPSAQVDTSEEQNNSKRLKTTTAHETCAKNGHDGE